MTTAQAESTIPTGTWSIDPVHSSVGYAIEHGVGTFHGGFSDYAAELVVDGDGPELTGTVRADSITIDQEDLRAHLLSPEFFDVERHPEIGFESKGVRLEGNELVVEGELTIKGITKPIEGRGEVRGPSVSLAGTPVTAVDLEAEIDRRDFGLDWQAELPNGGDVLGNAVKITVHLELQGKE